MAHVVIMPKEGITVESCLVGKWHKDIGDPVAAEDVLFEYETDKAAFECASAEAGVLLHKFFEEGDEAPVLQPVAIVGDAKEDISALITEAGQVGASSDLTASNEEAQAPAEGARVPGGNTGDAALQKESAAGHDYEAQAVGETKASPRARSFAAEQGIDLSGVSPSGPDGRILEADAIAAANEAFKGGTERAGSAVNRNAAGTTPPDGANYTEEPFTKIRSVIAKSMMASLHESAQLTHHHSFDAASVLAMREDFKTGEETIEYRGVSVGDIILYVTSRILAKHPEINATISKDSIRKYSVVNLGVAIDTPRGLMVPTIFGAEKKSLREISAEVKSLAAAAREGKISPDLMAGGTFTVSNLGATGVEMFTPIINPPQIAILGVCGVTERVRTGKTGRLKAYPAIGLSLTYDHRAIDGAPASRFAKELCETLAEFSWKFFAVERERSVL